MRSTSSSSIPRVAALVAACLILLVATPASAAGPPAGPGSFPDRAPHTRAGGSGVTVYGSGYGHGLGMSQWGAYGLAKAGWGYTRILRHFYSGTKVAVPAQPVKSIRVGLTYDRSIIHLKAAVVPTRLWIGAPTTGKPVAKIPVGATWTVRAAASGYAIRDASGALVGGKTWGGAGINLYATFADRGGRVFVPEADAIWNKGFTYAHGYLEFNEYGCGAGACRERLILPVGFEDYLLGIGEMPASWPIAALKSQAVAARTFATYAIRNYGMRSYCNCQLTDGSNDQTYVGFQQETGAAGARWSRAVRSSARQVITYKGHPIQAFFAASDGGHSDSVEDVWHGGDPRYAVPYLRAVCDPGEFTSANPWKDWSRGFTRAALTDRLAPYTGTIGTVTGFPKVRRGDGGRLITIKVKGTSGSASLSGSTLRGALGLPDDRIWINSDKNIVGAVRAKYDALMCAPGLPTTPVVALPGGARQKYQTGGIFRNNAAALSVWLKGPIYQEYLGVGGAMGALGLPTTGVTALAPVSRAATCTGCRRIVFDGGRIFAKPGVGAHALWGPVLKAFLGHGGVTGSLGFPTSRVTVNASGASATFEHGQIDCPSGGTCQISG
jgi:SpoIID/LytB domain protein